MGLALKTNILTIIVSVIITLVSLPTVLEILRIAETEYYPVLQNVVITEKLENSDSSIQIRGTATKVRNCQFENIAFFRKSRFGDMMVTAERINGTTSKSNPVGTTPFGPWKVDMSLEEFNTAASIKVLHRCHPLFLTESIIYDIGEFR